MTSSDTPKHAVKVEKDFSLLTISIVEVVELDKDGVERTYQHAVNAAWADNHLYTGTVESIPWAELVGRKINSVFVKGGRLVLSLTTKGGTP
jgi:hypothetical protein